MNESTKSIIRHTLTALGTVLVLLGLGSWAGVIDFLNGSLDGVWDAIITIIGFVTTLFGYFKESTRHKEREVGVQTMTLKTGIKETK